MKRKGKHLNAKKTIKIIIKRRERDRK